MADAMFAARAMLALPETVLMEYDGPQLVVYGRTWLALCIADGGERWLCAESTADDLLSLAAGSVTLLGLFLRGSGLLLLEKNRDNELTTAAFFPSEIAKGWAGDAPLPGFSRPALLELLGWSDGAPLLAQAARDGAE